VRADFAGRLRQIRCDLRWRRPGFLFSAGRFGKQIRVSFPHFTPPCLPPKLCREMTVGFKSLVDKNHPLAHNYG